MERKITIKRLNNVLDTIVISFGQYYSYSFTPEQAIQLGKLLMDMGTTDTEELSLTLNDYTEKLK